MSDQPSQKRSRSRSWIGFLLWLTTIAGLYFIRQEVMDRDVNIQRTTQELLVWADRAESALRALDADKIVEALNKQSGAIVNLQESYRKDADELANTLISQREASSALQMMMGKGIESSSEAARLAEEAWKAERRELAVVYLVNSISGNPDDVALLKKYADWVVQINDPMVIQGAELLLQEALYAVKPADVVTVAELLDKVVKAQEVQPVAVEPFGVRPDQDFAEIEKHPLSEICEDRQMVEARLESLAALLTRIDESNERFEIREKVVQRYEEAQACVGAHQVIELISMRLENVGACQRALAANESDENRTAALSALQAAELAVNQIWNIRLGALPPQ